MLPERGNTQKKNGISQPVSTGRFAHLTSSRTDKHSRRREALQNGELGCKDQPPTPTLDSVAVVFLRLMGNPEFNVSSNNVQTITQSVCTIDDSQTAKLPSLNLHLIVRRCKSRSTGQTSPGWAWHNDRNILTEDKHCRGAHRRLRVNKPEEHPLKERNRGHQLRNEAPWGQKTAPFSSHGSLFGWMQLNKYLKERRQTGKFFPDSRFFPPVDRHCH